MSHSKLLKVFWEILCSRIKVKKRRFLETGKHRAVGEEYLLLAILFFLFFLGENDKIRRNFEYLDKRFRAENKPSSLTH